MRGVLLTYAHVHRRSLMEAARHHFHPWFQETDIRDLLLVSSRCTLNSHVNRRQVP
jgi:hypothetical protein